MMIPSKPGSHVRSGEAGDESPSKRRRTQSVELQNGDIERPVSPQTVPQIHCQMGASPLPSSLMTETSQASSDEAAVPQPPPFSSSVIHDATFSASPAPIVSEIIADAVQVEADLPPPYKEEDAAPRPPTSPAAAPAAVSKYLAHALVLENQQKNLNPSDCWTFLLTTEETMLEANMGIIHVFVLNYLRQYKATRNMTLRDDGIAILRACLAGFSEFNKHGSTLVPRSDPMVSYLLAVFVEERDEREAERHLHDAVAGGVPQAFALLANLIKRRMGPIAEVVRLNMIGVHFNDPKAHFAAYTHFMNAYGVSRDTARAVCHLKRAAELGFNHAEYELGNLYSLGRIVPLQTRTAIVFLSRAASNNHLLACIALGRIFRKGAPDVPRDYPTAQKWYIQAGNEVEAIYQRARLLIKGRVSRDSNWRIVARSLLRQAIDMGHARSQYRFGLLELEDGNKISALKYFNMAASNGYSAGFKRAAKLTTNSVEQHLCYRRGAQAGDPGAMMRLGELYITSPNAPEAQRRAGISWLKCAINKKYVKAEIMLAELAPEEAPNVILPQFNVVTANSVGKF